MHACLRTCIVCPWLLLLELFLHGFGNIATDEHGNMAVDKPARVRVDIIATVCTCAGVRVCAACVCACACAAHAHTIFLTNGELERAPLN